MNLRTANIALAVVAPFMISALCARAQEPTSPTHAQKTAPAGEAQKTPPVGDMSVPDTDAPNNWTPDQILTATVHQAWVLSGKDEAKFFEIVKELAEISARNRNLTIPDNPVAGRRAGAYIKAQAKADPDQLLYDIVDKSIRMSSKPMTHTTTAAAK